VVVGKKMEVAETLVVVEMCTQTPDGTKKAVVGSAHAHVPEYPKAAMVGSAHLNMLT
jgi:hypothetical protein